MARDPRCKTVDWNWEQFLHDERVEGMSDAEVGAWVRVLGAFWLAEHPGRLLGSAVRRIAGDSFGAILPCLKKDGEHLVHDRTKRDYDSQTDRILKQEGKSRAGGIAKAAKNKAATGMPQAESGQALGNALLHSFTPASQKKETKPSADFVGFDRFWTVYPKKVGRKPCFSKWKSANLEPKTEEILAGLERVRVGWSDPQFIPNPLTFLNQERWMDQVNGHAKVEWAPERKRTCPTCGEDFVILNGWRHDICPECKAKQPPLKCLSWEEMNGNPHRSNTARLGPVPRVDIPFLGGQNHPAKDS